jgi:hypothetical protein
VMDNRNYEDLPLKRRRAVAAWLPDTLRLNSAVYQCSIYQCMESKCMTTRRCMTLFDPLDCCCQH